MLRPPSGGKQEQRASSGPRPLISVALPVHNGDNFLEAALESVYAQTYTDFELVVSDNSSTDGTASILEAFAARDTRLVVARAEAYLSQADNVTRCVDLCRGVWVKLLCHDDLLDPQCLQTLADAVTPCPAAVGLVGHGERWLFENGALHTALGEGAQPTLHCGASFLTGLLEGRPGPPLPSLTTAMVRGAAWDAAGTFDPRFQHFDLFFWAALVCQWDYLYVPTALSTNRIHRSQVAVSARRSLATSRDHAAFWPEFLREHREQIRLTARGRWRTRLKPYGAAATALAIEAIKHRPLAALTLLRQVPRTQLPVVLALTPLAWRREQKRTAELRERVPAAMVYP